MIGLFLKLETPKPADWGFNVTVCIAAICDHDKLVTVTDQKIDFGNFSADSLADKFYPLHMDWSALVAGNDGEYVPAIIARAQGLLGKREEPKTWLRVASALQRAFEETQQEHIRAKVLSRFKFTVPAFRDRGRKLLTASAFNTLISRVAAVSLNLRFLVVGFDGKRKPHIFVVDGDGSPKNYDEIGFWAIGTGASSALSSMAFHAHRNKLRFYSSLEETIYHACEAKFISETDKSVGKTTLLTILEHRKKLRFIWPFGMDEIRRKWEKVGIPRAPKGLIANIPSMIYSTDETPKRLEEWIATKEAKRSRRQSRFQNR